MQYVLIIFISFGVMEGGATSQHIEFANQGACESARTRILTEFNSNSIPKISERRAIIAVCAALRQPR